MDLNALIVSFIVGVIILVIGVAISRLPIRIAKKKNLESKDITTITVLTWCGLVVGITWIIALCLAIAYRPGEGDGIKQ